MPRFHGEARVGRLRDLETNLPDEWSSLFREYRTRLIGQPVIYFSSFLARISAKSRAAAFLHQMDFKAPPSNFSGA